jgi:hypothetical protein
LRVALTVLLGGALITLALLDYRHYSGAQQRAAELSREHALAERRPELAAEVRRHYDPVFAELRVARALLDDELDRSWLSELPADRQRREAELGVERLRLAGELAQRGWPRRPSSWEAALVLGGATYLELYRTHDPRLLASAELWEQPLLAAKRLGPAQTGPVRFLAAAYIGNWASLSDAQKDQASALLAQGFEDPRTYCV